MPGNLAPTTLVLAAITVLVALAPLARELGPFRMPSRAAVVTLVALGIAALMLLTVWGQLVLASDLAPGGIVLALAAGLIAATPIAR